MISLWAMALMSAQPAAQNELNCAEPTSEQNKALCSYLERIERLEVRTLDSVAMGTHAQMQSLRVKARECGLINRIDYVAPTVSVFEIINATPEAKSCIVSWIAVTVPELTYSDDRLDRTIEAVDWTDEE